VKSAEPAVEASLETGVVDKDGSAVANNCVEASNDSVASEAKKYEEAVDLALQKSDSIISQQQDEVKEEPKVDFPMPVYSVR
jgi:hypothetical protein